MATARFELTPLTPIHIGTGEEFGPWEYFLDRLGDWGEDAFCRFDSLRTMARLAAAKPLVAAEIADMSDYRRAALKLHAEVNRQDEVLYVLPAGAIQDTYHARLCAPENQLLVQAQLRDPRSSRPMIPGSSLKGAIRTAMLSAWTRDKRPRGKVFREYDLLDWSKPSEDPFRALAISDCIFPVDARQFVGDVVNYSRRKEKFNTIQIFCEQIDGIFGWAPDQVPGVCEVRFHDAPPAPRDGRGAGGSSGPISPPMTLEALTKACRDFYHPKISFEKERFYRTGIDSAIDDVRTCSDELAHHASQLPDNAFIVRLGRYSHFESVTLDAHRSDRVRGGSSRNLSCGQRPMGWLRVDWHLG